MSETRAERSRQIGLDVALISEARLSSAQRDALTRLCLAAFGITLDAEPRSATGAVESLPTPSTPSDNQEPDRES